MLSTKDFQQATHAEPRLKARLSFCLRLTCVLALLAALLLTVHDTATAARPIGPEPPRALVLDPFATDLGHTSGNEPDVAGALQRAGYSVTVLRDKQATVPSMLKLSKYAFIYFFTHAGPLPNSDAAIATGDTRHQPYKQYLNNYSLAEMRIAHGGAFRYFDAITGRFIHLYLRKFPAHTIIFINSCNVLDMPLFWRYLRKAGVETLISWHRHVSVVDADRAAQALFARLGAGDSVADAISTTVAVGAGTSDTGGKAKPGTLAFAGNGDNTLIGSPTPSPSP